MWKGLTMGKTKKDKPTFGVMEGRVGWVQVDVINGDNIEHCM